jgi:hypothetical protein
MAVLYSIAGTVLAATTQRRNTRIDLDVLKAFPLTGVLVNLFVRDTIANANNHESSQ